MIEPLFSVILPAYNVEKTIKVCIDSVIDQTFPFFELIVCNDGSTDSTQEIIESYSRLDERVKVINRDHRGVSWARQECLEAAVASYIVFLDGDDALEPNCFEEFAKAIDINDPDIVCCGYRLVNGKDFEDIRIKIDSGLYSGESMEKVIFPLLFAPENNRNLTMKLWAKAIRKDLVFQEHSILNPDIAVGQDFAVMASCLYRAESVFVSEYCLYDYRNQNKNIFTSSDVDSAEQYIDVIKHIQDRVDVYSDSLKSIFKFSVLDWMFNKAVRLVATYGYTEETTENINKLFGNRYLREIVADLTADRFTEERRKINSVLKLRLNFVVKKARQSKKSQS